MSGRFYLDASAAVKLVVAEPESAPLRSYLEDAAARVSSRVLAVELVRAAARSGSEALGRARSLLAAMELIELDATLAEAAASLEPAGLRSLDAIHLASALALGDELDAFVTYDARQAEAARGVGLNVVAPA